MSSHSAFSPICPDSTPDAESDPASPQSPTAAVTLQVPSDPNGAVPNLLRSPQSARSAGTAGATTWSLRGRGSRSPVEPLISSPLRISSSAMASAPSSPERPKINEDLPRRSLDQFNRETDRRASTGHVLGLEETVKSEASPSPELVSRKNRFMQPRDKQGRSAMAAVMSGLESRLLPKSFTRGRDTSRGSTRRGSSLDSRSPSAASLPSRSISPSTQCPETVSKPTIADTEKGKAIKMEDAHNKSDEALAKPPGGLPDYVKPVEHEESGERLAKDVFDRDKNMIESSEDDADDLTSDDEQISAHKKGSDIRAITPSDFQKPTITEEPNPSNKTSELSEKKPRKSALKAVVHPQTSFDIPTPHTQSAAGTPYGSEDEAEKDDIHRAQRLSISMSAIDNRVPNRSIRTIIRGNFAKLQEEADGGRRRQRKYLVATDLSEESVYALEWTIGALLRDGDTMYALYTMHEDSNTSSVQVGEGAKAMQDAAVVVRTQTREAQQNYGPGSRTLLSRLGPGAAIKSPPAEPRASPLAEAERVKAVEGVANTCVKLLRKTLLQVRIAVEVIHCKSPKLMITEAIDEIEPTLVIVGARGQSALKGVLLGSFSNYLLSNSSAPVMVARRKLKRHPSKSRLDQSNIRLTNNLRTPKSLTQAKVD
ncbi:hypothetical protein N7492_005994 [Penicillium capsulatum]|uniref:UspA domain-containing protein n=1 Tax=Penicillium capsulatum TaxID=69766 RepID=A0A9W9IDH6_9EURO|nr:hypothetical protein N7492_005994 [Penicillium capsulatum]KAJ6134902.1 hypothetical protein N7512_000062 [Penicillium capsulatum]